MGRVGPGQVGPVFPSDSRRVMGTRHSPAAHAAPLPKPTLLSTDSTRAKLQLLLQLPIKSHFRAILSLAKLWGVRAHPAPGSAAAARCWSVTYFIKTTMPKI